MKLYCAECGLPLTIKRVPLPKYATIIDTVVPHVCLDNPIEIDLKPIDNRPLQKEVKGKFVKSLNDLGNQGGKGIFGGVSTADLHDRRFDPGEPIKSTAPPNILNLIDQLGPTQPAHNLGDFESED